MTGAGNDFVVIDNRRGVVSSRSNAARKLCDRRFGVGADGLLLVERSSRADYKMQYYNSDGSYGGMCGNGGRCIALFSLQNGIATSRQKFEALGHVYHADVSGSKVTLRMKNPRDIRMDFVLRIGTQRLPVHFVDTGSPHVVLFVQEKARETKTGLEQIDVLKIGRAVRYHRRFSPRGTNVNFVQVKDAKTIQMRTYERGVEDETLACGTGAIASAIISQLRKKVSPPVNVVTRSNQVLTVDFSNRKGKISNVSLTGPAEVSFNGEVDF
jgi:diaminopimelate epimerase